MNRFEVLKWIHLLGAATWTGGLIVLAFLVTAIRRHTDDIELLRVVARRFGVVSWVAFATAVTTGLWMYIDFGFPWREAELKITLVVLAGALALVHQLTARWTSAAVRGIIQLGILVLSIGIFGAAVTLI